MQIISLILETNKVINHLESNISITPKQAKKKEGIAQIWKIKSMFKLYYLCHIVSLFSFF